MPQCQYCQEVNYPGDSLSYHLHLKRCLKRTLNKSSQYYQKIINQRELQIENQRLIIKLTDYQIQCKIESKYQSTKVIQANQAYQFNSIMNTTPINSKSTSYHFNSVNNVVINQNNQKPAKKPLFNSIKSHQSHQFHQSHQQRQKQTMDSNSNSRANNRTRTNRTNRTNRSNQNQPNHNGSNHYYISTHHRQLHRRVRFDPIQGCVVLEWVN